MLSLEKRIASLEGIGPGAAAVVFIMLVKMGEVESSKELVHIYDNLDNHWHREPSETEVEFKGRATVGIPRRNNNVALLFGRC